jgi:hypothetical protein
MTGLMISCCLCPSWGWRNRWAYSIKGCKRRVSRFKGLSIVTSPSLYLEEDRLFVQLRTAALRLIVLSWLDVPSFATRRLHACHHARAPSGGRWNCGREMSGNFAEMTTYTPFRDLVHAAKLRHGTDGFTSRPKEGVLRIFFRPKNPTGSAGCEPANLSTRGQHATSRPPKPIRSIVDVLLRQEITNSVSGNNYGVYM